MKTVWVCCKPLSSSYCYSSVSVWLSSIKPVNTGLRINKPDAWCRRYLSSSFSTPSTAIANFSQLPLPEVKERHTVATVCGIEVSLHLYENKLFFRVRRIERVGQTCTILLWEKGWIISPWSLISYRTANRAVDCLSQER